jgi:hypothetical protein
MEGFIHRLKLLKRQAYGRAGVDFLRHRLLGRRLNPPGELWQQVRW